LPAQPTPVLNHTVHCNKTFCIGAKDVGKLDANGNCRSNLWHVRGIADHFVKVAVLRVTSVRQ